MTSAAPPPTTGMPSAYTLGWTLSLALHACGVLVHLQWLIRHSCRTSSHCSIHAAHVRHQRLMMHRPHAYPGVESEPVHHLGAVLLTSAHHVSGMHRVRRRYALPNSQEVSAYSQNAGPAAVPTTNAVTPSRSWKIRSLAASVAASPGLSPCRQGRSRTRTRAAQPGAADSSTANAHPPLVQACRNNLCRQPCMAPPHVGCVDPVTHQLQHEHQQQRTRGVTLSRPPAIEVPRYRSACAPCLNIPKASSVADRCTGANCSAPVNVV